MTAGHSRARDEAARLLGVVPDAAPAEVKRAFRLWATWAHPDQGGSAERFRALCAARDRLLEPTLVTQSAQGRAGSTPVAPDERATLIPRPRRPWRTVLVHPTPFVAACLVLGFVASVAAVLVVGAGMPLPWGIAPAALASAAWCVAVSRAILRQADHGHVIVTRSVAWGSATGGQLLLAALIGLSVVEALPLLAVPFVMAIAAVNPAAGLRQSGPR